MLQTRKLLPGMKKRLPWRLSAPSRHQNPWLGIKIEKPADFKFAKLDAVWPDPTVVELEGPADVKATLEQCQIYPWQEAEKAVLGILAQLVPEGRREKAKMRGHDVFITDSGDGLKSAAAFFRGLADPVSRQED
jgi:hypothetical protein